MAKTATINGQRVELLPDETVLQAALRSGIDFPHSCRVGGCATCKCRLTEGEVQERTETAYLLTADELASRTILACQSVPTTDVRVEVDLAGRAARRTVKGRVTGQTRVTHDIAHLSVQLDEPLVYQAGQFAPQVARQVQNLRLQVDAQGRGGRVADDQPQVHRRRTGDGDALAAVVQRGVRRQRGQARVQELGHPPAQGQDSDRLLEEGPHPAKGVAQLGPFRSTLLRPFNNGWASIWT